MMTECDRRLMCLHPKVVTEVNHATWRFECRQGTMKDVVENRFKYLVQKDPFYTLYLFLTHGLFTRKPAGSHMLTQYIPWATGDY